MTTAPAWSLTDAEAVTSSIDLARTVGVPVGVPVIVLAIDEADDPARWRRAAAKLAHLPVVTIAAGGGIADAEGDIDALVDAVLNRPHAATVAALLGRHLPADPVEAFHAESLAYATLQAGPEHPGWLATRGHRVRRDDAPRVRLDGTEPVVLTLTRPRLHNLLDRRGRDELTDAFRTIALLDEDLPVHWVAEGPSFCAGGDPAEFGTVARPAHGPPGPDRVQVLRWHSQRSDTEYMCTSMGHAWVRASNLQHRQQPLLPTRARSFVCPNSPWV